MRSVCAGGKVRECPLCYESPGYPLTPIPGTPGNSSFTGFPRSLSSGISSFLKKSKENSKSFPVLVDFSFPTASGSPSSCLHEAEGDEASFGFNHFKSLLTLTDLAIVRRTPITFFRSRSIRTNSNMFCSRATITQPWEQFQKSIKI